MHIRAISLAALACGLATPAFAASDAAGAAEGANQGPIIVEGLRGEYGVRTTRTGTRTDTDIMSLPQAITVVTEQQIEDQAMRSIADVLTYVPGATPATGEGNRDQIVLRGNNTTADFFVNGIRDDVQYFRDLYNVERVEVLRGPNAMIFGRGGGGGVVNRVTKRSLLQSYREFAIAGDSEGSVRLSGDVDLPLASGVGLRINGVYDNGESFRDHVELERYGINPTLGVMLGAETRIDLAYEYFHDGRTTDRGIPAFGSRPLEGADSVFFGDPEQSYADADVHLGGFAIEHRFSDAVTLRNRTQYADYDKFYQNVFPGDLIEDTSQVRLAAYNNATQRENLFSQTDLVLSANTGGIGHTLLLGFELGRQDTRNQRLTGYFQPSNSTSLLVPASDPTVDADIVFRQSATDADNEVIVTVAAAYVQDQIRISDLLEVVAGLRFDRFDLELTNFRNADRFDRTDELVSPRFGVILHPNPQLSFYGSYSRSYLPSSGDQFASLDATSEAIEPERFDNYELGARWQPLPGLIASLAVYQLDRTNTRAPSPDGTSVVLTGEQRSRGIELELAGRIRPDWQISAGYALQEAEITRTTAAAPAGREVPLVPRHQFSLWNRYDATPQLGFGLGLVAASRSYASISNSVVLPGYARVDAAVYYEIAPGIEAQVNVENLFGADYFPTAHSDNNIAPGAPVTARAALRFGF